MTSLRSQRGYAFETSIVKFFNKKKNTDNWYARRLGGATSDLPDVVITYNDPMFMNGSSLWTVEAKSSFFNEAYIPQQQIQRCIDFIKVFQGGYGKTAVIFAFKFSKNIKKNPEWNSLEYYYFKVKSINNLEHIDFIKCYRDGRIYIKPLDFDISNNIIDENLTTNIVSSDLKLTKYYSLEDLQNRVIRKEKPSKWRNKKLVGYFKIGR